MINRNESLKIKKAQRTKELLCIWSILIIPLINLCIFWVYGTIQSVPIAFEHRFDDGSITYDFSNFKAIIDTFKEPDNILAQALTNTLTYWSVGFFFLMPACFLMAFFLYKKILFYKFFRLVFFFPSIISSVIIASFFKYIFGPGGQIPYIWETVFGKEGILFLANSEYAFPTMIFYNVYTGLTGFLLYWLSAYARLPEEIMEAGRIDGLTDLGEFWYIAVPLILPFYATMALLSVTGILDAGGAALLLTGGAYGTYDIGFYLYKYTVSGTLNDQGISGAVGLIKGAIVLPLALIINRFVNKIETVEY